jgi:tripartite-type tricarboxylate transporter receptor subunit TctC
MKLERRNLLQLAAGAALLPVMPRIAKGVTYPTRPVRLIVGFAAGGGADTLARLIGQWLSERLGEPFVIEHRLGAGTNIAAEAAVRAPPDGYTLLVVGPSNAINATLYDKLNFIGDITPVASLIRVPLVMEVNPSFSAITVLEFIGYAKANPSKINLASAGNGAPGWASSIAARTVRIVAHASRVSQRTDTRSVKSCVRAMPPPTAASSLRSCRKRRGC